jgi:hypothetical protein
MDETADILGVSSRTVARSLLFSRDGMQVIVDQRGQCFDCS